MSILRRICFKKSTNISFLDSRQTKPILNNLKQINSLPRFSTTATNCQAAHPTEAQAQNSTDKSQWTAIYRFPLIRWASAFNRLKVYQGAVSIAGIPASFMLEQAAIVPPGTGATFTIVGFTGLITLALSSLVVQNLIGFIYVDRSGERLKFAYVDYWGRRQDYEMGIYDLVPDGAQEKPTKLNFYQIIGRKNNEKFKLKLLQRYGVITNGDIFYSLFY